MMHVCHMQAMSSCVGLHPASGHYLGTIGARLNPLIYAQGETLILSSWASPRSTHKQNMILSLWVSLRPIHNKHDPQFVGFPEINTQQTRSSFRGFPRDQRLSTFHGLFPSSMIINLWVFPGHEIVNSS
ncbi:hypothetical protein AHAS_Ahas20G0192300 [Arachis hypogaea]